MNTRILCCLGVMWETALMLVFQADAGQIGSLVSWGWRVCGNELVLSWPASAQNFSLQATTNLADPIEFLDCCHRHARNCEFSIHRHQPDFGRKPVFSVEAVVAGESPIPENQPHGNMK